MAISAFSRIIGCVAAYGNALDLLLKFPLVQESYEGLKKINDRPANVIPIKPEIHNPRKQGERSPASLQKSTT
jgi:hypothetical protein